MCLGTIKSSFLQTNIRLMISFREISSLKSGKHFLLRRQRDFRNRSNLSFFTCFSFSPLLNIFSSTLALRIFIWKSQNFEISLLLFVHVTGLLLLNPRFSLFWTVVKNVKIISASRSQHMDSIPSYRYSSDLIKFAFVKSLMKLEHFIKFVFLGSPIAE